MRVVIEFPVEMMSLAPLAYRGQQWLLATIP